MWKDTRGKGVGAKCLVQVRPKLQEVIANLEKANGQIWAEMRDRYGDEGRDFILYLGRRACGMKLPGTGGRGRGERLQGGINRHPAV
jgi:hypothetical protein